MELSYGYCIIVIFLVVTSGTIWLFWKREDKFIKCRDPHLLLFLNGSVLLSAVLLTLYIAFDYETWIMYCIVGTFGLVGMTLPLMVRAWRCSIKYHGDRMLAEKRFTECFPNRVPAYGLGVRIGAWLMGVPQERILLSLGALWAISLIYFCLGDTFPLIGIESRDHMFFFSYILFGNVLLAGLIPWYLLRIHAPPCDTLYLRLESSIIGIWWVIILAAWFPHHYFSPLRVYIPPVVLVILGYAGTFLISTVFPLFLITFYFVTPDYVGYPEFVQLLESVHFRNAFYDFLSTQFAEENLQFYEVVVDWKPIKPGPYKDEKANRILEKFVVEEAPLQIDLPPSTRDQASQVVKSGNDIPGDVFDEAVEFTLEHLHIHSFYTFKSSSMFEGACTEV